MFTPKTKINTSLASMRKRPDGRVVGDPGLKIEDIQKHTGVPLEIVRAVLRHQPILERYDSAELLKLAKYFLSGAAKDRTPPEHHALLAVNAATVQAVLDERAAEEAHRASTVVARVPSHARSAAAARPAPPAPSEIKGTHLTAPTALERSQRAVDLAEAWLAQRREELALRPQAASEAAAAWMPWVQQTAEEAKLHLRALANVRHALHGPAGTAVRTDATGLIAALQRFAAELR